MNVINCYDQDGIQVVCDDGTWYNHIVAEHPEIGGCEAHVKVAIEDPYQIYQDATDINRIIIYQPFILPKPFHTQYLRIGIEYKQRKSARKKGYVRTAFACQNKRKGDILIWEKP